MSDVPVVDADRLTKFYEPTSGIEDLSFRLEPGEVLLAIAFGAIAVLSLVVDALAAQVSGRNPIRPLSPFRWYLDPDPLTTPLRPVNVLVLVGIAAVAFVVALVAFDRRDLAA